jgi:hypothetical protein
MGGRRTAVSIINTLFFYSPDNSKAGIIVRAVLSQPRLSFTPFRQTDCVPSRSRHVSSPQCSTPSTPYPILVLTIVKLHVIRSLACLSTSIYLLTDSLHCSSAAISTAIGPNLLRHARPWPMGFPTTSAPAPVAAAISLTRNKHESPQHRPRCSDARCNDGKRMSVCFFIMRSILHHFPADLERCPDSLDDAWAFVGKCLKDKGSKSEIPP